MNVVTTDTKDEGDELPSLSKEAVNEIADAAMKQLRAQLGRAPTLADIQVAMAELLAEAMRRLHAEEAAMISRGSSNVRCSHDEGEDVPGARTPPARRDRPR